MLDYNILSIKSINNVPKYIKYKNSLNDHQSGRSMEKLV